MKNVIFYNDGPVYGGHEVTALHAVKFILKKSEHKIHFIFSEENTRLKSELQKIEDVNLILHFLSFSFRIKSYLFNFLNPFRARELKNIIWGIGKVDLFVGVQGSIEISSFGIYLARKIGIPTLSFIPLCYEFKFISKKGKAFGLPRLRDFVAGYFYNRPDHFITVSKFAKQQLVEREKISESRVAVIYCGVDPGLLSVPKERKKKEKQTVGIIGRVEFGHKNQLFLVEFLKKYYDKVSSVFEFVIVGDGKDLPTLQQLVQRAGLNNKLKLLPWQADPGALYSNIDIVMIPSFFEGIPLVLYEAMYLKIPILASNIPGHAEMLPENVLFSINDFEEFYQRLIAIDSFYTESVLEENRNYILKNHTIDKFGMEFSNTLDELIKNGVSNK